MGVPLYWVDAFTEQPFSGNPAAVCVLDGEIAAERMQNIAAEMNLSETAFLHPEADGYRLRWFTPTVEVDLCGHATLASAFILWRCAYLAANAPVRFYTRSGLLTARMELGMIWLDFPAVPARMCPTPAELSGSLRVPLLWVGNNGMDLMAELAGEQILRDLVPDMIRLALLPVRGIIITARGESPGIDFVSRFFGPAAGVPEDPVTGSAHCCLGPYWARKLGKTQLVGYQASRRGGTVRVKVQTDRVELGGKCVLVAQGKLEV